MGSPVVTVVIPTYNHAHFLKAAIQSVRDQSFGDWEAIVVNNYSEDNTVEIVASFNDPRIRLVNFHNHGIIAASRNHGIGLAQGEYVAFLDSDDLWYPDKLEKCMKVLRQGGDAVCHGEVWVSGTDRRSVTYGPYARASYESLLFNGNCLSTSAIVVRREALNRVGGFDEAGGMVTAEDYELWLRLARSGVRFQFLDEMLGEYRLHPGNASKAILRQMNAVLEVLDRHFKALPPDGLRQTLRMRRRRALEFYVAARNFQTNGDSREAWHYFTKAVMTFPFIAKMYAGIILYGVLKLKG